MEFEFVNTQKLGSGWDQEFFVARRRVVYLRMVGNGTDYRLMTATANEDTSGHRICDEKERLLTALSQLATSHNWTGELSCDRQGRPYFGIELERNNDASDNDFSMGVNNLIEEFFAIYDSLISS